MFHLLPGPAAGLNLYHTLQSLGRVWAADHHKPNNLFPI